MKHRIITFAFLACFSSSLAFADNPTDAPLLPNVGSNAVVQQEKQTDHKCKHAGEKDKTLSAQPRTENPSNSNRQGEQTNPNDPPAANY